jgi:hypothetical protein
MPPPPHRDSLPVGMRHSPPFTSPVPKLDDGRGPVRFMCVRGFIHCGCGRQVASPVVTIRVGCPEGGEAHPPSCIDGYYTSAGFGGMPPCIPGTGLPG